MTLDIYNEIKSRYTDNNSKAFQLLDRVFNALLQEGIAPLTVNCNGNAEEMAILYNNVGYKYISICTVYRNNGTSENVSCKIELSEVISKGGSARRFAEIKVPKDASDKVIKKRIEKAKELLNA